MTNSQLIAIELKPDHAFVLGHNMLPLVQRLYTAQLRSDIGRTLRFPVSQAEINCVRCIYRSNHEW